MGKNRPRMNPKGRQPKGSLPSGQLPDATEPADTNVEVLPGEKSAKIAVPQLPPAPKALSAKQRKRMEKFVVRLCFSFAAARVK